MYNEIEFYRAKRLHFGVCCVTETEFMYVHILSELLCSYIVSRSLPAQCLIPLLPSKNNELEVHSVERIYLRQRCLDASKPCLAASTGPQYQYVGFSRRHKILCCSAYAMEKSNPVPASGLWSGSGSKVNQFVHVPTSVDTQHFIQINARLFSEILHTDRQTNEGVRSKTYTSSVVVGKLQT